MFVEKHLNWNFSLKSTCTIILASNLNGNMKVVIRFFYLQRIETIICDMFIYKHRFQIHPNVICVISSLKLKYHYDNMGHKKRHLNIMNHVCGKTFRTKQSLQAHNWGHTGENPFGCFHDACDRRFRSIVNRDEHM